MGATSAGVTLAGLRRVDAIDHGIAAMKSLDSLDPLPRAIPGNTFLARRTLLTMAGLLGALSSVMIVSLFYIAYQLNHSAALQPTAGRE